MAQVYRVLSERFNVQKSTVSSVIRTCLVAAAIMVVHGLAGCGAGSFDDYQNGWLYPADIETVYVEMFDSSDFRRGREYVLTDAICKRIETDTPYKIVSDVNVADTILSGQINAIYQGVLTGERYEGNPLELEAIVTVTVSWKNLRTGDLLIDNEHVSAWASYSTQLGQSFDYASNVAANRAAQRVVELMEVEW